MAQRRDGGLMKKPPRKSPAKYPPITDEQRRRAREMHASGTPLVVIATALELITPLRAWRAVHIDQSLIVPPAVREAARAEWRRRRRGGGGH